MTPLTVFYRTLMKSSAVFLGAGWIMLHPSLDWRPASARSAAGGWSLAGTGVTASRMAQLSPESQQKLREMALQIAPPAQGQAGVAVEGIWEGELRDADGTVKAVSVEMRLLGGRLGGTMAIGRKVTVKVPLQDITVQGGTLRGVAFRPD